MTVFEIWEEIASHPGGTDLKRMNGVGPFWDRAIAERAKRKLEKRGKDVRIIEREAQPVWC